MVHKKKESKENKFEKPESEESRPKSEEPHIKKIIRQIEDSIGKASQTHQKEIEEYEIVAIAEKIRKTREQEHVAEKTYRKAYDDAKELAARLSKGTKYLNGWG